MKNLSEWGSFFWVVPVVVMSLIMVWCTDKKPWKRIALWLMLGIWAIGFLYLMFLYRLPGKRQGQIIMDIFYMYKVAWKYKGPVMNNQALRQILFNMLLFVPLGAIVRALTGKVWVTVAIGIGLSVLAEGLQFATGLGFADIDDVISNSVGLLIGVLVRNSNKTLMTARCDRLFSEF